MLENYRFPVASARAMLSCKGRGSYALEQCGLLLRDANTLYRSGSYASTVVLAAFAREELGRSMILIGFWPKALQGKNFTKKEIRKSCDDHATKQREGMLSTVMRTESEEAVKLLQAKMTAPHGSTEWKKASANLKQIIDLINKRAPNGRHEKRMSALYVEPLSGSQWNRPAKIISSSFAREFLQDVVDNYKLPYYQGYITPDSVLEQADPELYRALEQWPGRPELLCPEGPDDAGS